MPVLPRLSIIMAFGLEKGLQATLIGIAAIGGIIAASILLLLFARRLRRKMHEQTPAAGDALAHFRELHARGELSREEYQRIRSSLAQQIRRDVTDTKKEG